MLCHAFLLKVLVVLFPLFTSSTIKVTKIIVFLSDHLAVNPSDAILLTDKMCINNIAISQKNHTTVQASFTLEKPVSELIPYIKKLEYDIYSEIGVPNTEVAVLSIHQSSTPNLANITFGVLSNPLDGPINSVYLSLLKQSLVELFLKQSNLSLTTSIFGNASMFEIATIPGGITVIPWQLGPIIQIPEILFNFTLNSSINSILDGFDDFKNELRLDLDLRSYEVLSHDLFHLYFGL
ncbi:hypothetical protein K1719_018385 [Acacia pycnantha]|nr:hypothetical protein K1719_018385 [Acacia pycnantha]